MSTTPATVTAAGNEQSAAPTITLTARFYDPTREAWWTYQGGNEVTIPESQLIDFQGENTAAPGHSFHVHFTGTKNGQRVFPDRDFDSDGDHDANDGVYGEFGDDGTYELTYQVIQDDGVEASATFVVKVVNEAPRLRIEGPESATAGSTTTIGLSGAWVNDRKDTFWWDSFEDEKAGITYQIDWDGDGGVDQTVVHDDSFGSFTTFFVPHTYTYGGDYTVTVTGEDKDGAVSDPVSLRLHVDGPLRPVDPQPSPTPDPDPAPAPQVQYCATVPTVTTSPFHTTTSVQDDSLFADTTPVLA